MWTRAGGGGGGAGASSTSESGDEDVLRSSDSDGLFSTDVSETRRGGWLGDGDSCWTLWGQTLSAYTRYGPRVQTGIGCGVPGWCYSRGASDGCSKLV